MATLTEPQPAGQPQPNIKPVDTLATGNPGQVTDLRPPERVADQVAREEARKAAAAQAGNTSAPEMGGFDVSKPPATPNAVPINTQTNPFKLEATEQGETQATPDVQPTVATDSTAGPSIEQTSEVSENNTNHTITPDAGAPQPGEVPAAAAPQPEASDQTQAAPDANTQPATEKPKRKKFLGIF